MTDNTGTKQIVIEGINLIKKLGLMPANKLTPSSFARECKNIAKQNNFKYSQFTEAQMKRLKMGGITSVSQGSNEEARLITLEYSPKKAKTKVLLVGKGITFDSGGISIKHSGSLHEMKYDMLGGAMVLALMQIAAKLKLQVELCGVIGAAENMPSAKALKPGDVIKTYSGKTVEVLNTDAEGRLVLADCLTYGQEKFEPDLIVDIATLTKTSLFTLGNKITPAFGNSEKYNKLLQNWAEKSSEPVHFLPLFSEYESLLKSQVADISNIAKYRFDTIIGALFLKQFVAPKTPWIHLDIGATSFDKHGPNGVLTSTLVQFISGLNLKK